MRTLCRPPCTARRGAAINAARDLAWGNSLLLRQLRDDPFVRGLFLDNLAVSVAVASRLLLVAV